MFFLLMVVSGYVVYNDVARRQISNSSVMIVALTVLLLSGLYSFAPIPFMIAVITGVMLFHFNWFAGGDIKLMLAYLAGIDTQWWPGVLVITGLLGGVLALMYISYGIIARQMAQVRKKGLPYGVPIAMAGVLGVFLTAF